MRKIKIIKVLELPVKEINPKEKRKEESKLEEGAENDFEFTGSKERPAPTLSSQERQEAPVIRRSPEEVREEARVSYNAPRGERREYTGRSANIFLHL